MAVTAKCAPAAWHEEFEGPQASWQPGEADLEYRVERKERVSGDAHAGHGSELIQISGSLGTYAYFTHDVPAARIVAELTPSVWVKANRPGIQILARVILPQSLDPRTGKPIATLVRGSSYSSVGSWQQLRIVDIPQLLSRQVRVLRAQIGPDVEPREAYVDQVLLNVYGGPGQTAVLIDDLEVAGLVPRSGDVQQASATEPVAAVNSSGATSRQVTIDGSLLLVDGKPILPRVIRSQGEPLAWLKQQGFNTVRTTAPITAELLAEAQQAGVWLIGPPPTSAQQAADDGGAIGEIAAAYEPVLAWNLGSGLASRELPGIITLTKQLRAADRQLRRPLIGSVEEQSLAYSRQLDVLTSSRSPLGTSLELKDYGAWLRERPRLARPGTPLWTTVQTEMAPELVAQCAALAGKQAPEPTVDPEALRLLTYQAFAAGARGIEFASSSRLDANDNTTRIRALSLALLNLELELIEPWGAAGNYVASAASTDQNIRGVVLSADNARLLLAMRCSKWSQYVAAPHDQGAALVVPGVPDAYSVYELTPAGLRPLPHKRVAGGVSVNLEDFLLTSAVLITPDPVVINSMTHRTAQLAPRAAQLQRDLSAALLAETEAVARRLGQQPQLPPSATIVAEARTALARADELLKAGDYSRAYLAARNATLPLGRWRREAWERTVKPISSPAESPLASSFATLPEQINIMSWLALSVPGENLLAGGDFEDLPAMLQSGWQHFEHAQPAVQSSVELSPTAPYGGRFSLRLQARAIQPDAVPTLVESTPLWITSAPIHLDEGDVVCIRGQARVKEPISGSIDGLMIIDSLGSEPLAERIGETNGWRQFTLYRAAASSSNLTVTFALTGLGEACIDDVSVRLVRRGGANSTPNSAATRSPAPMASQPIFGAPPLR